MGDFKIVGDNMNDGGKKEKIIKITCIVIAIVVSLSILCGIFYYFYSHRTPEDYSKYEEKTKLYEEHDIEYTYEDYKQDEKAIKEIEKSNKENDKDNKIETQDTNVFESSKVSEATKKLNSKNKDILQQIKDETLIDSTTSNLVNSIIKQTSNMNKYIKNHCGYESSEWADESFDTVKEYHDSIVASMSKSNGVESIYPDCSVSQLQAETRYAIYENIRLTLGNDFPRYYDILSGYMSMGHPNIKSINSISLKYFNGSEKELWDGLYYCDLKATISTEKGVFKVFLTTNRDSNGNNYYKILDIRR